MNATQQKNSILQEAIEGRLEDTAGSDPNVSLEPAWEKVHGLKFELMQIRMDLPNGVHSRVGSAVCNLLA